MKEVFRGGTPVFGLDALVIDISAAFFNGASCGALGIGQTGCDQKVIDAEVIFCTYFCNVGLREGTFKSFLIQLSEFGTTKECLRGKFHCLGCLFTVNQVGHLLCQAALSGTLEWFFLYCLGVLGDFLLVKEGKPTQVINDYRVTSI